MAVVVCLAGHNFLEPTLPNAKADPPARVIPEGLSTYPPPRWIDLPEITFNRGLQRVLHVLGLAIPMLVIIAGAATGAIYWLGLKQVKPPELYAPALPALAIAIWWIWQPARSLADARYYQRWHVRAHRAATAAVAQLREQRHVVHSWRWCNEGVLITYFEGSARRELMVSYGNLLMIRDDRPSLEFRFGEVWYRIAELGSSEPVLQPPDGHFNRALVGYGPTVIINRESYAAVSRQQLPTQPTGH
jgi:hypothetical protein